VTEFQKLLAIVGVILFSFQGKTIVQNPLHRLGSGAALATVVGVLEEVPIMLSLVAFSNKTKHWLPEPAGATGAQEKVAR